MFCPVWICHAADLRLSRAVQVRGFQLAAIGERFLGRQYEFMLRGVPAGGAEGPWMDDLRGGVVLLSIGAVGVLPEPVMAALAARNRALVADWVGDLPTGPGVNLIDIHAFGSLAAFRQSRAAVPDRHQAYLTHHADLRIAALGRAPQDRLRPLWPGDPAELAEMPRLARRLTRSRGAYVDLLPHLAGFNLHVEAGASPVPRLPLTGVFAAAAVGANVLIPRGVDDAVDYLGEDYPYLVESARERDIAAALDRAKAGFGGPEWRMARERMHNMADRSSAGTVASDLDRLLEEATGIRLAPTRAA